VIHFECTAGQLFKSELCPQESKTRLILVDLEELADHVLTVEILKVSTADL
jgi:hypothetical protein